MVSNLDIALNFCPHHPPPPFFPTGTTAGKFDHYIVNDDVERAYAQFKAALQADIDSALRLRQSNHPQSA